MISYLQLDTYLYTIHPAASCHQISDNFLLSTYQILDIHISTHLKVFAKSTQQETISFQMDTIHSHLTIKCKNQFKGIKEIPLCYQE